MPRARDLAPFHGEMELGAIAEQEERYEEALAHYAAATNADPAHAWAQHVCGRVLVKLGRAEEARARFDAALRNDPALDAAKQARAAVEAAK